MTGPATVVSDPVWVRPTTPLALAPIVFLEQAPRAHDYSGDPEAFIYLRMNSAGTETNVVSGETFTETGTVTLETSDPPPGFGGSYRQSTDGDSHYLEHDGLYLHTHSLTGLTVMGWIRGLEWTVNRRMLWIVQRDVAPDPDELAVIHGMKGQAGNVIAPYQIVYHPTGITADIDTTPTYATNVWIHHCMTFSTTTMVTWINGVAVETNSGGSGTIGRDGGTPPWMLWNSNIATRDWHGDLDDVFVMTNRILNSAEINECMDHGVDGKKGAAD